MEIALPILAIENFAPALITLGIAGVVGSVWIVTHRPRNGGNGD